MPLPPYLISVSLLVCERVLRELDNVLSAIRVVDVFYIPQKPPEAAGDLYPIIQAHALASLRTTPGYSGKHVIRLRLINTVGESSVIGQEDLLFQNKPELENAPSGGYITAQVNFGVKRFGTCYFCLDVDGEEISRVPITLVQMPTETKAS